MKDIRHEKAIGGTAYWMQMYQMELIMYLSWMKIRKPFR